MPAYNPQVVEPRWQKFWEESKIFKTPGDSAKPKYYILDMFPYPSGAGLHVGHPEGYTATDILARYKRMRGFNVLHPMGWDAFGLPAEQYAVKEKKHPHGFTQQNIGVFRRQIKSLGFSYDWDREVDTTDPNYYRWTQWIFLQLYDTWYDADQKKGRPISELPIPAGLTGDAAEDYRDGKRLAYQAEVPVNWCSELGTVLANEEVIDGKSERGGHPVVRMPLKQWLLRITEYAERLIEDLSAVDWPEPIKKMQRDWIGRSEGAEVDFGVADSKETIRVFTTRPDTLFGATYMVLSPEHPLVDRLTTAAQKAAVDAYRTAASHKSDLERTELAKTKSGVFTGAFAINPVNQVKIPIWIADYVLVSYGTGAIMAVPGHDERDFEFAKMFDLPIVPVVLPPLAWLEANKPAGAFGKLDEYYAAHVDQFDCFSDDGTAIHSGEFDGKPTATVKAEIIAGLEAKGQGARKINFKLRDWLFSRQRYWGEPFPILHELDATGKPTGRKRPAPLADLPLRLPDLVDYAPTGKPEPPLAKATDWLHVTLDGKKYLRETNTMPQWAGSCWYFLRYIDPQNAAAMVDPSLLKKWLPVDLYVGGAEHAVLHLLYSRFWHKVLFDRGHVPCAEPFQKLVNQGMILGEMEFTAFQQDGQWVSAERVDFDGDSAALKKTETKLALVKLPEEDVEKKDAGFVLKAAPTIRIDARAFKMSKSRGNVINPDTVIQKYGADSLRLYEMFMGPLEATKPWSMRGVEGVFRFLNRVWRLIIDDKAETLTLSPAVQDVAADADTQRRLHQTIKKVTDDLDSMSFNTAISAMMELTNHLTPMTVRPREALKTFLLLLAPFAPHLAEELWQILGGQATLAYEPWPRHDESLLKSDTIEVPVQINGKVKGKLTVAAGLDKAALEAAALAEVQAQIAGKAIKKVIVVPGKMVNIVV